MAIEIRVPVMGESVVEATVGRWFKRVGESVAAGERVVELETDKVNLEVAAEQAGVLARIAYETGATVAIGDVLAELGPAGTAVAASESAPASAPTASASATPAGTGATPVARRVAEEHGVDVSQVPGSGPRGRTTKDDVLRHVAPPAAPTPPTPPPAPRVAQPSALPAQPAGARREERQRLSRRRLTIAQRLLEAQQTAAMLTTFNEVDMQAILDIRKRRKDAFKERHGVGLGFMSFFTRAVLGALKAFPLLNSELQGDELIIKHYYDLGVAVSTDAGLVVPVLRDADHLSFAGIERGIATLAERARNNTLTLDDLRGGTFSITNGGVFGSLLSTPILNPPQVGILGMHKIQERPVALNGQVVIRPLMYLALTYDHRIIDGREAVQFLVRVKELAEDPEALLLEG